MVTINDLDKNVEVSILVPVVNRAMGNFYKGAGPSPQDLKSYGFNVTMSVKDYVIFVQDVLESFRKFHVDRFEKDLKSDTE